MPREERAGKFFWLQYKPIVVLITNVCSDPGSWLKPKFQKKAFSSLWGTLEGSLTKFVSGEEVPTVETVPARKSTEIMSRYQ